LTGLGVRRAAISRLNRDRDPGEDHRATISMGRTAMAKAKPKKRKRAKVRDLKPRKSVKGGMRVRRSEDPCAGGEISR
jgi:hypothetical protein